jgi:tetratricopeptide (TPR) repeat protein
MNTEKSKQTSSNGVIEHQSTNIPIVQNVLLIWLDHNIDEKHNNNCRNAIKQFRRVINNIYTFTECDPCVTFLSEINEEKVCIIVSGSLGQQIVPKIHSMSQLDSIFIFCDHRKHYKRWAKKWLKIKGVFTETTPIYEALQQSAKQCEHDAIGINFMSTKLDCSFMYSQIIKEILLTMEFNEQHIKQFINYSRKLFHENEHQLNNIKQFKQIYDEETSISWYTYDCFINPMLNRALRLMDMEIIIKMGFFIRDLHRHIEQVYSEYHFEQLLTLYRGQGLSKTDFEQMMKTKGGFISFNNFLSASKDSGVSLNFAHRAIENPDLIGILFIMTIDPSKSSTPFALINDEVLFSMYTVFRIEDIKQLDETNRLWQVNLILTNDKDQDLCTLTERMREDTYPNSNGWGRLGLLLIKMNQLEKAEQVYNAMLEQTSDDQEKAGIYHQLGWIKDNQGQYEEAVPFYEKALVISQKMLPPNHPDLAMSYNNIGLVYYNMSEYPKALSSHEKALEIRRQTLPENHSDLAMSYNNIGMVYATIEQYSKAFPFCQRAVDIGQRSLPSNHPHLQWYRDNFDLVKKKLSFLSAVQRK